MKRIIVFCAVIMIFSFVTAVFTEDVPIYKDSNADIEARIEDLLSRMTLEEKAAMLSGDETRFDTRPNERLGIPALNMADGPVGVRSREAPSTAFPASICTASTWNTELVYKLGQTLGQEAKAKGKNVLLAPCINIHRVPHGGRNFESFGEDPYLTSEITVNYIKGVQNQGVIATAKHFAANNQENERFNVDVRADERTLQEIYLPAFKAAVQEGGVWAIMSAYNRLNGHYCSANTWLLTDTLKNDWGFKGFVMSDWGAVHSAVPDLYAGLDLEMPTTQYFKVDDIKGAVQRNIIQSAQIDDKVARMLRAMFTMGYFDQKETDSGASGTPENLAVARQIAEEGVVLLKNQENILPLSRKVKSLALIGPNAGKLAYGGGGSSRVNPTRTLSPKEAFLAKAGKVYEIRYAPGTFVEEDFTLIPAAQLTLKGKKGKQGILVSYYAQPNLTGECIRQEIQKTIDFSWQRQRPDEPDAGFASLAWEAELLAPESGTYNLALGCDGEAGLFVDGKEIIDTRGQHGWDLKYKYATLELEADQPMDIKVVYYEQHWHAAVRLLWQKMEQSPLDKAVEIASSSDIAILFLGSTLFDDSEGQDRKNLSLPPYQEELILKVSEVNPNTVMVLHGGAGVEMERWLDRVQGLLMAWFPGQEGGDALANILLGNVNPSGKLATTFSKRWEDCPAYGNYPGKDGKVNYAEGIFVGYRYFDAKGIAPLFPFGHGLSYTDFEYKNLTLSQKKVQEGEPITVNLKVKNTGKRDGAEVVQLYLGDEKASVLRPVKELKGFKKIFLKAGEEKNIAFVIKPQDMKFFDVTNHNWKAEPGKFSVYLGSSSWDIRLQDSFVLE